ncbi:Cytokine-inducible SH2-containing protein-like [Oopsacas minuta]|uniref:Cytokine-inducible SH2-containing protein-like n=1 Tax=Oopsacas minuta TaxID=111878 RepID=A0AAV7JWP3_9METZ|nr:Cytokine-inducible SH2-containing protein-like [Oopsacas minuta]
MITKLKTFSRRTTTPTTHILSSRDSMQRSLTLSPSKSRYKTGQNDCHIIDSSIQPERFISTLDYVQTQTLDDVSESYSDKDLIRSKDVLQSSKMCSSQFLAKGKSYSCTSETFQPTDSTNSFTNHSITNDKCNFTSHARPCFSRHPISLLVSFKSNKPIKNCKNHQTCVISNSTDSKISAPPLPLRKYHNNQARKRSATLPTPTHMPDPVMPRTSDYRFIAQPPLPPRRKEILPQSNINSISGRQFTNSLPTSNHLDEKMIMQNIRDLVRYGWYWGPMNKEEAENKLHCTTDGTFLVRDSSDDRHLLTISFRTSSKTFHTRIEFWKGKFSVFPNCLDDSYDSVGQLIDHAMNHCKNGVFFYR